MSKSANVDIHNLFHKFGGNPNSYHEIKQQQEEEKAQQNWPIIMAMKNELQNTPKLRQPAPAVPSSPARPPFPAQTGNPPPASSLYTEILKAQGAPAAASHKPETAAPGSLSALFGSLHAQNAEAPSPPSATTSNNQAPVDNSLNQVFSRLLDSPRHETETRNSPQDNLRSMLQRLNR